MGDVMFFGFNKVVFIFKVGIYSVDDFMYEISISLNIIR